MIAPITVIVALCLGIYALRSRKKAVTVPNSRREFVGEYTCYKFDLNNKEHPLHFDSTGTGKFYRSKDYFAFYIEDKAVFVRSRYTSTMNEDQEEHFTFDSNSYAVCYWKQQRLVINHGILNDGRQGYQYELTNFNVTCSLDF